MADDELKLPDAKYPIVNRVITLNPLCDAGRRNPGDSDRVCWEMGQPHPLLAENKVVRIYCMAGVGIEIYSFKSDGKSDCGVRNSVPWDHVCLVEELMDPATFVEEIQIAEEDAEGGDEKPSKDKPNGAPAQAAVS